MEQPANPDDLDDFFNWPWLVAGEMGDWKLTDAQVKTLREYLLRGGFLYMDDFWGPEEWARFDESMTRVFPDRPIVEIEQRGLHLPRGLRSGRAVPDAGHVVAARSAVDGTARRRNRAATGWESTTITIA